jgi:hypothetical protein
MKDLLKNFLIAKSIEEAARAQRVAAEVAIADAMGNIKLEGTTTCECDGWKVSVTTKLTRTLDYDKYVALGLPIDQQFVVMKPAIDLTALRVAQRINPSIADCITTTPAKPSVKVEVIE